MPINHAFHSDKTDGDDSTELQPSHWNANHTAPTLAEVLVAGNDLGAADTITATPGANGAASLYMGSGDSDPDGGGGALVRAGSGLASGKYGSNVFLMGGNGGSGSTGAAISVDGGDENGDGQGGDLRVVAGSGSSGRNGLVFLNLPTSDPAVAGALWSNLGVVQVSNG